MTSRNSLIFKSFKKEPEDIKFNFQYRTTGIYCNDFFTETKTKALLVYINSENMALYSGRFYSLQIFQSN